jgi:drug/metabolite transporter (DMT)-like permease
MTSRPRSVPALVIGTLAVLLLVLAAWLALATWWDQRTDETASSYGAISYVAAFLLAVLAATSLSTARASRAADGARATVLLVLAAVPLVAVGLFVLAGMTD